MAETPTGGHKAFESKRNTRKIGEVMRQQLGRENFEPIPDPVSAIQETAESISYLGVRLPKAEVTDSVYVPKREQYADYISDRFALDLQRTIAVSMLQGDPLLIEGGTSIGKTTTVRKMASELGYEVHYANLNGATDVEDLMGRYIPNPNRHTPEDPEYIFADGKVTSGLRVEEGKRKIIILDEFNAAAPNILIRLHETLDALSRGENVVLAEDASEAVPTDKEVTKVVALMNPPGKGYFGREPLDP
ncbi:MAG: AAA family ATPase, partial [Rhabdochlamydiaceae bacterium]